MCNGQSCPYLKGASIFRLIAENKALRQEINVLKLKMREMEQLMEKATTEITSLHTEIEQLKKDKENLLMEARKKFKPNITKESISKKGAPEGHIGRGRKSPERIDEEIEIYPETCPRCGSKDITVYQKLFNEKITEDIEVKVKNTRYRVHYGYCPNCKRTFYPKGNIPSGRVGPLAQAISGYLHYQGVPYRKVANIFNDVFGIKITHPPLMGYDNKFGEKGEKLYKTIKELIRQSGVVNADETGWRIEGQNGWLWVFAGKEAILYKIDRSRGSEVVKDVLGEEYNGILGSDFYSAYNGIKAKGKQKCITHLLREIKKVEEQGNFGEGSIDRNFCRELKSIFKDAIEIGDKKDSGGTEKERIVNEIIRIITMPVEDKDVKRIRGRVIKYNSELLTFLKHPEIEPTNNCAERYLRPSVIMRKLMFGNRSERGANNHSVIMSIIQTGILNKIKPLDAFTGLLNGSDVLFSGLPMPP